MTATSSRRVFYNGDAVTILSDADTIHDCLSQLGLKDDEDSIVYHRGEDAFVVAHDDERGSDIPVYSVAVRNPDENAGLANRFETVCIPEILLSSRQIQHGLARGDRVLLVESPVHYNAEVYHPLLRSYTGHTGVIQTAAPLNCEIWINHKMMFAHVSSMIRVPVGESDAVTIRGQEEKIAVVTSVNQSVASVSIFREGVRDIPLTQLILKPPSARFANGSVVKVTRDKELIKLFQDTPAIGWIPRTDNLAGLTGRVELLDAQGLLRVFVGNEVSLIHPELCTIIESFDVGDHVTVDKLLVGELNQVPREMRSGYPADASVFVGSSGEVVRLDLNGDPMVKIGSREVLLPVRSCTRARPPASAATVTEGVLVRRNDAEPGSQVYSVVQTHEDEVIAVAPDGHGGSIFLTAGIRDVRVVTEDEDDDQNAIGSMMQALLTKVNPSAQALSHRAQRANLVEVKEIGYGSFSKVYLARDRTDGKEYALKKVNYFSNHSLEEPKAWMEVNHPNIVPLIQWWTVESTDVSKICMLMPYYALGTLNEAYGLLGKQKPSFLLGVLGALSYIHADMIVHLDIKPENIMIERTPHGTYLGKLGDFGLVKILSGPASTQALGQHSYGTEIFCAHEAKYQRIYSRKSDVFSMGLVMYCTLAECTIKAEGKTFLAFLYPHAQVCDCRTYSANLAMCDMQQHKSSAKLELVTNGLPEEYRNFAQIIRRMLQFNRKARPTADLVRDDVAKLLPEDDIPPSPSTVPPANSRCVIL